MRIIAAALGLLVLVVGSIIIGISQKQVDVTCKKLQQTGRTVMATVNSINLYQTASGPPAHSEPTTDITQASHLDVNVTYATNAGGSETATIHVNYTNHHDLATLYQMATSGSLNVTYLPNTPHTVRPASEFTKGAPVGLCQSG